MLTLVTTITEIEKVKIQDNELTVFRLDKAYSEVMHVMSSNKVRENNRKKKLKTIEPEAFLQTKEKQVKVEVSLNLASPLSSPASLTVKVPKTIEAEAGDQIILQHKTEST